MLSVCILSRDLPFARFVQLELADHVPTVFIWKGDGALPQADAYVADLDTCAAPTDTDGIVLCCGWGRERPEGVALWVERPFRPARLRALLGLTSDDMTECPMPCPAHRSVLLAGREIPLSDCEFRLFCLLYEANGAFLSREHLHLAVWNGEGDEGVVNVYIHYLRRKLETDGHTRLRSARGRGYALIREEGR